MNHLRRHRLKILASAALVVTLISACSVPDDGWVGIGRSLDGIAATTPLSEVPPAPKNMSVYAWTNDNSYSAGGPGQFMASVLETLEPGEVLVANRNWDEGVSVNEVISREDFMALDCENFIHDDE